MKPFSQACENNKQAILEVLLTEFREVSDVLEIGSGTGQHATFFAPALPHLIWQPSDRQGNLAGLRIWCEEALTDNLLAPLELDVTWSQWPLALPEALFTANSLHIMGWRAVEAFFAHLGSAPGAQVLVIYGPFNYGGAYTSESNAGFDQWLQQQDPVSAIRDFEQVDQLASAAGYSLYRDYEMPANNRLLVWRRS